MYTESYDCTYMYIKFNVGSVTVHVSVFIYSWAKSMLKRIINKYSHFASIHTCTTYRYTCTCIKAVLSKRLTVYTLVIKINV